MRAAATMPTWPAPTADERQALHQVADGLELIARGVRALASAPIPEVHVDAEPGWITPEAAARIAGLPMDNEVDHRRAVRRVYGWAREGQRWASRPNARTLVIEETGFRRWLRGRAGAR